MPAPVVIESLDQEGRGVAHAEGKVIFIEGALPGELVTYNAYRKKSSFELAQVGRILKPGFSRVAPLCRHFNICGGCSLQHMDARSQVAAKQRVLEDNLKHIGKVEPDGEGGIAGVAGQTERDLINAIGERRAVWPQGTVGSHRYCLRKTQHENYEATT